MSSSTPVVRVNVPKEAVDEAQGIVRIVDSDTSSRITPSVVRFCPVLARANWYASPDKWTRMLKVRTENPEEDSVDKLLVSLHNVVLDVDEKVERGFREENVSWGLKTLFNDWFSVLHQHKVGHSLDADVLNEILRVIVFDRLLWFSSALVEIPSEQYYEKFRACTPKVIFNKKQTEVTAKLCSAVRDWEDTMRSAIHLLTFSAHREMMLRIDGAPTKTAQLANAVISAGVIQCGAAIEENLFRCALALRVLMIVSFPLYLYFSFAD